MESPSMTTPLSVRSLNDDGQRVKFLCSFSGSILPRPQDGKLRYVGGETRIMSVPRGISYKELMDKMRELYEGATVMKYQQPDEDLDALVSVVNDDDVANMMEEYDKLGSGDGFTRLRVFLFAYPDQDVSVYFGDGDEWDNERRYLDALNSLNESPDVRRQRGESLVVGSFEDVSVAEQYLNQVSAESSPQGARNMELPMAQMNLRHLTIPRRGSGQLHQAFNQRINEMEAPWSPAYYSPRLPCVDQRPVSEFPTSPSSSRYRMVFGEHADTVPEDYSRPPVNIHPVYEQWPPFSDNVVFISAGTVVNDNICENCQVRFQRNQVFPSPSWRPGEQPLMDQNLGNGYPHVPSSCAECFPNREVLGLNPDANLPASFYCRDQNDTRIVYPETNAHKRGWTSPSHPNLWSEDPSSHLPVPGRLPDGYIVENGVHYPIGFNNDLATGSRVNPLPVQEHGIRYEVRHGHFPPQAVWRNVHGPPHGSPSYEACISPQLVNSPAPMGFIRGTAEGSPGGMAVVENLNARVESERIAGSDRSIVPEYCHIQPEKHAPSTSILESPNLLSTEPIQSAAVVAEPATSKDPQEENNGSGAGDAIDKNPDALAPSENVITGADVDECAADASEDQLEFLPELIESAKEAALKSLEVVRAEVQEDAEPKNEQETAAKEHSRVLGVDGHGELEADSDYETVAPSNIELTEAEAKAIDRGLQTIKNEDLEEIRELGSGTYGSVYHGKWKGSDVAIKRIKASCFAGRPSERERLIADFWKEALLLSSLHHPNVVAFYGVVRDGPDGSLATVTEFMINGSLKQFLQKKDRTIDRRKRLIIAMDAAFGMEYLHGKNIVHFDLKCENLLVNMRDPHRPVCKIGDLGLSKVKQHTLVSGGVRGTLPWMAPELLSGKSNMVTEKIDVYSFGIVMWELLTGDEPYADMHCAAIIGGIVNNALRPQIPTWCDPEWKSLMESCWASDPSERPSFSEISQILRTMAAAMNLK